MLITRETDYAIRLIRALFEAKSNRLTIKEICDSQCIPQNFVYKIAKKLSRKDIIAIKRGVSGGCVLIKDPHDFSLYDVMAAIDAVRPVSACTVPGFSCPYREKNCNFCNVHNHLEVMESHLQDTLSNFSIYDLMVTPAKQ